MKPPAILSGCQSNDAGKHLTEGPCIAVTHIPRDAFQRKLRRLEHFPGSPHAQALTILGGRHTGRFLKAA